MRWIDTGIPDHPFFAVFMRECGEEIEWAAETAGKKTANTIDTWQGRTPCKRFSNIFMGDLAKCVAAKFMVSQRPEIASRLLEYDRIRKDDFRDPDDFDLSIGDGRNIEVKSSGEKRTLKISGILDRRIIINVGNLHQHFEWMVMQVMFVPKNLGLFANDNFACDDFVDFMRRYVAMFCKESITAIIAGCANREMQEGAARNLFSVQNQACGAKRRSYADVKIKDSISPLAFLDMLG